jgi:hypothetical protein
MLGDQWLYLTVAGVLLVHLALAISFARRMATDRSHEKTGTDHDAGQGETVCRECGTTNDHGYRFCRACVAELPNGWTPADGPQSPLGRRV